MKSSDRILAAAALSAFAWVVLRAATQSITIDEATSYILFAMPRQPPAVDRLDQQPRLEHRTDAPLDVDLRIVSLHRTLARAAGSGHLHHSLLPPLPAESAINGGFVCSQFYASSTARSSWITWLPPAAMASRWAS
ncbi:MAG: hypothetical protein WDO18_15340 [Acidobacteriota bacterium]